MVKYRNIKIQDIDSSFLDSYNRYQTNTKIYFMKNKELGIKDFYFEEDWDQKKKRIISEYLQKLLQKHGVVIGAFDNKKLVGFACIEHTLFFDEYVNVPYMHVTREYRGKGIGKKLFYLVALEGLKKQAKKLYISANPAYETIQFYLSCGVEITQRINQELLDKEPDDIQFEYRLDSSNVLFELTRNEFKSFKLVNASAINKVASRLYRFLPKNENEFLDVCDKFLQEKTYGFFSVATLWMKKRSEIITLKNITRFEEMLYKYCDNWARVDQFCYRVLNPMTNQYPEMYNFLLKWSDSKNKDVRRASLVSMIISSQGQALQYDYDKMIFLVDKLKEDDDFHVKKGCGWILKYAYVTYPVKVEEYLRRNVSNLDRIIFRYALELVPNPLRKELINL